MVKIEIVKEMMEQRNFKECKTREDSSIIIGVNDENEYIYIKMFSSKFELNTVREFLWSKFDIDSGGVISIRQRRVESSRDPPGLGSSPNVAQLVIICASFQNSHVKEFTEISKRIQIIKSDFFNINITKKAPLHQKVNKNMIKNKKELPIIKEDDPNCVFYNFSKGDVIRVIRFDGDICYRLVK
jgi:DNA-directed RNA polymerase subunit H (RpoH/RPB5)